MKNKTEEKESRCDLSVVSVFIRKLSTFEGRELNCNSNSRYTTRNICKIYIIISLLYTYTYTLLYNLSQPKVPMVIIYRNTTPRKTTAATTCTFFYYNKIN